MVEFMLSLNMRGTYRTSSIKSSSASPYPSSNYIPTFFLNTAIYYQSVSLWLPKICSTYCDTHSNHGLAKLFPLCQKDTNIC